MSDQGKKDALSISSPCVPKDIAFSKRGGEKGSTVVVTVNHGRLRAPVH